MIAKLLSPHFWDFSRKQQAEPVPPETDQFMADIDAAFA